MSHKQPKQPVLRPQYATVASDAVLAVLTLSSAKLLAQQGLSSYGQGSRGESVGIFQLVAATSLATSGVAAAIGTLRFAGISGVIPAHDFVTGFAMFTSMPILGLIMLLAFNGTPALSPFPLCVVGGLIGMYFLFRLLGRRVRKFREPYVLITSLFGIMCLFFRSILLALGSSGSGSEASTSAGWYGLAASALMVGAGAVTSNGVRKVGPFSFNNVDAFHYLLAVANICFVGLFTAAWF